MPHLGVRGESARELAIERRGEIGPLAQLPRDRGRDARERRPRPREHARDDAERAVARLRGERARPAERLVEHRREREHIGPRAHARVAHLVLFGRRVPEAHPRDRHREVGRQIGQLHEAEVRHLGDLTIVQRRDQDVRRLEIAVDDALLVHRVERERDLPHEPAHARDRQPEASVRADHARERLPVDQLHREEGQCECSHLRGRRVVEADDVRVRLGELAEPAQHLGLALEALECFGVHGLGAEDFDDERKAVRPIHPSAVNPALSALADDLDEVIADLGGPFDDCADQSVAQIGTGGSHTREGIKLCPIL